MNGKPLPDLPGWRLSCSTCGWGHDCDDGASGYVAGTYLSSAAISGLVTAKSTALGVGILSVTGVGTAIIGSAGIFGTTIGASGLTGVLMSIGIVPATPIGVPIAIGAATLGGGYLAFVLAKLRRKLKKAASGDDVEFSEVEAKIREALIRPHCL